jgi:hypothetical protein
MAVQYIGDNPINGGVSLGQAATSLVSMYGATPVAQRASAIQASSLTSASSYMSIASNVAALLHEITLTLNGLGIWKGAA